MECRTLSATLRPSAPGGRGLRRRPSVCRPPFGTRPAPARQKNIACSPWNDRRRGGKPWRGERKRPPCLRSCPAAQRFAENETPQSAHTAARSRIHPPQRRPTRINLSTVAPKEKATQDAQGHPRQKREVENHKNSVLWWRKQSVSLPQRYAFFSTPSHPVPAFRSLCALPAPAHPQRAFSSRHFPKAARPSAKVSAKSPRLFAFSSPLSEKSPLVLEKSPHVFLPSTPPGSPSAAVAQEKNVTSSEQSAQKCASVHFFLILIAFI